MMTLIPQVGGYGQHGARVACLGGAKEPAAGEQREPAFVEAAIRAASAQGRTSADGRQAIEKKWPVTWADVIMA
jgi:hypothetical protein